MTIEGNNALHLALTSASFAKFKQRAAKCVKLGLDSCLIAEQNCEDPEGKANFVIDMNASDRLGRTILHLCTMHGMHELL